MSVLYKKTLFIVGLSFRLVRNLSGKKGFPTRFTCGNDRVLVLSDVFLRWLPVNNTLDSHIIICLYIHMSNTVKLIKLFSDDTRLRVLMLISRKELCVCQIMGVLGISQPLVSRNLAILSNAGLIRERKDGKLVFYSLNEDMPLSHRNVIDLLQEMTEGDRTYSGDMNSLKDCEAFQKKAGRCDMKTLKEFMHRKTKTLANKSGRIN